MTPDEQHRVEKIVKVLHWVLVVFASWFLLMAGGQCSAQEVNLHLDKLEPNYGLAVTGTGMTLCAIGTTMSQSPQAQYNGQYGLNYVRYDSSNGRTLRLSTMAAGAIITIAGIIIQNKRRRTANG